jgi:tetratricopeptide (TPR) repeat protein
MKDPLQTEVTHYEVLGLERGATHAEIESAFKAGLVKRANVQKLLAAKQALQQPSDRAMLDLFHYDPRVLERLAPNPLQDPSHLQAANRARTAAAWEKQLKANFPDVGIAHCLGVLWYWWAVHAENQPAEAKPADSPAADQLWQQAIAYWGMVVASRDFWNGAGASPEVAKDLPGRVVDRFRNLLLDLGQKHGGNRYHGLELALTTEVRTAKDISAAGLRTSKGTIACGPLLLGRMGILDSIRQQIESALQKQPANAKLKALRDSLSPFSTIAVLLDHKKPQPALDAINALPPEQQELPEVSRLRARALAEIGRQKASLGQVEEALDSWKLAVGCQNAADIVAEVHNEVISVCQARAAALQKTQRNRAILILEKGLKIVKEEKLQLTLAELLVSRGIEVINEAHDKAEKEKTGVTPEIIKTMEKGQKDLERAAKLGSKRGEEQAAIAKRMIEQARSAGPPLPGRAGELLRRANEAANRDDWDTAIKFLREALQAAGSQAPQSLRANLAVALTSRGIDRANRAIEKLNASGSTRDRMMAAVMTKLKAGRYSEDCALCGKSRYSSYGENWFSFNLPDGGTAPLCENCAGSLKTVISSEPDVPYEVLSLLESARDDLREAARMDPSNQHTRKNLTDVEEAFSKLSGASAQAVASRSSARLGAGAGGGTSSFAWLKAIFTSGWFWWWVIILFIAIGKGEKAGGALLGMTISFLLVGFLISCVVRLIRGR